MDYKASYRYIKFSSYIRYQPQRFILGTNRQRL